MLQFERHGAVAVLTLDRPEARNAINRALAHAIEEGIDELERDDTLVVGIVTHTGDVFSAGADLKEVAGGDHGAGRTERGGFAGIERRERSKPLIAAVDGRAVGGGCEIALACDLIVASERARFGQPEVSFSLLATAGGIMRLNWTIPPRVAMELVLTAETIDAARAYELGLVNRVVPTGETLAEALRLAESIARNAPLAVQATRRLSIEAATHRDEARFRAKADEEWPVLWASEDFKEGPRAFAEKRPPRWQGR